MPTILADRHHLPTHPLADFAFLRQLRSSGAGVGLFYRDVHWQFRPYRDRTPAHKRWPALAAYHAEVRMLRSCLDRLFVPSVAMARFVPGWDGDRRVVELPPGGTTHDLPWSPGDGLRLFYVGSVHGPVYDIEPLLELVVANERVSIVVCCPEFEAREVARWQDAARVTIVHEHGSALVERYRNCDASCIAFPAHPYREFMVPVKLFESIGMGRPILGVANDMAGRYVADHGVGWAPPFDDLGSTIDRLAGNADEVRRVREAVVAAQPQHTWAARCQTVLDELTGPRAKSFS
jgi:hypothetical protein